MGLAENNISAMKALFQKSRKGHVQSLAKLLTLIEEDLRRAAPFLAALKENASSVRIGITGPPGAGKSSLINLLVDHYRLEKFKVAVIAVDPSSPFSGGAILGDRIRMNQHAADERVFIRSVGSRGGIGGLSSATGALAAVLEAVGFDIVIIETVGVGQTELQVMNLTDMNAVVLVPESGDVIQTMKAGILEIADIFVVNKSDRPGAEVLSHELEGLIHLDPESALHSKLKFTREVLLTSTVQNKNIGKLATALLNGALKLKNSKRKSVDRLRGELRSLILWSVDQKLEAKIQKMKSENIYKAFLKFKIPKID